ncbi:hypothetical protein [uncultured Clostridium sp.]|jgi:hypothetical protein|uniref:hypothetical protein n=1 Tax=uncultured Clostridium sp. TaxID=59620 RepID=UPI00262C2E5B|nr:hypothetical protein [uncultured Clostridium sp.]
MKKKILTLLLVGSITTIASTQVLADSNEQVKDNIVSVGEQSKVNNLITYTTGTNNLSEISSEKGIIFDKPKATDRGILLKMDNTIIQTQYGKMKIVNEGENNGYKVINISNPKAPILKVGIVNNIYEVGNQVDLKALVAPVLYNSSGEKIKGDIIFPNVDTSKESYNETYIKASDGAGNITIAPFIYNVVRFKATINVSRDFNVQDLSVKDILSGGEGNLRAYIAHYDKNSNKIIVGVSRGVASIRKEIPIIFGEKNNINQVSSIKKNNPKKENSVQKKGENTDYSVSVFMQIFISPITYFVIGALLIALISFLFL